MSESKATGDADELARLAAEQRRLTEALSLADRDRQPLGYEIHDDGVEDLAAVAMLLEGAGKQAQFGSPEGQESYTGGVRLLQDAIAKARRVIDGAAAVEIDNGGLIAALTRLVDRFKSDRRLPVTFQ